MTSPDVPPAGISTSTLSPTPAQPWPSCQNETGFRNTTMEMATNFGNNNATTTPRLPPSTDFGPQINLVIWLLTALSSAFLAMRVYCKFLRHRGLWWDDYLLIGSWVSAPVLVWCPSSGGLTRPRCPGRSGRGLRLHLGLCQPRVRPAVYSVQL